QLRILVAQQDWKNLRCHLQLFHHYEEYHWKFHCRLVPYPEQFPRKQNHSVYLSYIGLAWFSIQKRIGFPMPSALSDFRDPPKNQIKPKAWESLSFSCLRLYLISGIRPKIAQMKINQNAHA